jgi:hypothetical protein
VPRARSAVPDPLQPVGRREPAAAAQRLRSMRVGRRTHVDCHQAVAGLGGSRRPEGPRHEVQRPWALREALSAARVKMSLGLLIALRDDADLLADPDGLLSGRSHDEDSPHRIEGPRGGDAVPPQGFNTDRLVQVIEAEIAWKAIG